MNHNYIILFSIISFLVGLMLASISELQVFLPSLLEGVRITIIVTLGGCVVAVFMALLSAFGKLYAPRPLNWLAITYIEIFRGTSALVQLFWLFFVLPHFGITLEPITVGILTLGLNVGAYGAEVVRGAVQAVPRGQWEATVALNMNFWTKLRRIILPQAFVTMIPPWGNLFIELLKATSLVSLITLADLTFKAQQLNQMTFKTLEIFTIVLVIYMALSAIITTTMRTLEKKFSQGLSRR